MFKSVLQFPNPSIPKVLSHLSLPKLAQLPVARPQLRLKQLEQWAITLPKGNTTVVAHQMLEKLKTLNHSPYPARERVELLTFLRPILDELLQTIREPLRKTNIPLDNQQLYQAKLLQSLQEQMAIGYKRATCALASKPQRREFDQLLLIESIYMAMVYLSHRLIDTYSLYTEEPAYVWSDLNYLYQFAEANQLHTQLVDDHLPDTPLPVHLTIDFAYKRILLLRLAEPYHLMQHEADDIFRLIASSVESCTLEPYMEIVTQGEYVIDLSADSAPRYLENTTPWHPSKPRIVDISKVKRQLNIHLSRLLRSNMHNAEFAAVSLVERQQRDMLLRLADAWHGSLVRQTPRFQLKAQVELTSGLNAAHHYISNREPFTPEMDELKLISHTYDLDAHHDTVFANAYLSALQKDRRHGLQNYAINPWWQSNVSPIGIALNSKQNDYNVDIRVGELVTYRFSGKRLQRWQIGVIRWLKHELTDELEGIINIGIMNLANGIVPIGIKALAGLGHGTEYCRGLFVPKQAISFQQRSLIVPAFSYDVGTILAVNVKNKIFYAKLTRMLLSTRSFTQFDFEIVQRPMDF